MSSMNHAPARVATTTTDWPDDAPLRVGRRSLLWLPIAAAAGIVVHGSPILAQDRAEALAIGGEQGAFAPLTRAAFGQRWTALADEMFGSPASCDESYVGQLAGLLARLPIADLPRLEKPRSRDGLHAGLSWSLLRGVTIEFGMDPGAEIRLHNHPPQIVLTLCAAGEVSYRHCEIEGEAPPCTQVDGEFEIRETRSGILRTGCTTSLTRARDGMHGFRAGAQGARLVDFTLSLTEDIETFSYVAVSEAPLDPERRLYTARWLGKQ